MKKLKSALAALGRGFAITALLLATLDAGASSLRAWPTTSFTGWFGDKLSEKVADLVRKKGERLYGKDEWFEKNAALDSTLAFQMALKLKLKSILLASLLVGVAAGVLTALRPGKTEESYSSGADRPVQIPMAVLILALAACALPLGAMAGFVAYLVADWQRRDPGPLPAGRKLLLVGYQLVCAFVIIGWGLAAQMKWGEGWSKMYPWLARLLGVK